MITKYTLELLYPKDEYLLKYRLVGCENGNGSKWKKG